jgi:hypothetical protein
MPPTIYMGCVSVCESNLHIFIYITFRAIVIKVGDYFEMQLVMVIFLEF